uniref:GAG-POL n=2 Tax=Oryza sativa subsp. japonica TaxID=39947 RepID=Q10ID2_ORYSJ|nr:putative GAG-POL precursor [Oryza sativa Japonica Group]ABF97057.1 retrotransposon protein, putative, Ty3-gypsy subclass, expressed [Oryza sativa Japonica Group]
MGLVSGIDDFVFPPGQAFRFGSLDFITKDFGKISLLDLDSNHSGRGQISAPFGIPNSAEVYPKIISTELASNHSDEIQSTSTRPDQDDGPYPPILMKLPDDLAVVFTTRAPSPLSTEQLDGYLSSPGVDSRPMEIVEYDDFGYRYDYRNLDDFDEGFEDNYTPLYFGIFMADNKTEEQRKAREAEELRVQQETERRRQEEEHQAQERERLQREQQEREQAAKEAEDWRQWALDAGRRAQELIGQQDVEGIVRRTARGYAPHHSPDRYDDDVDGVAAFTSDLRRVDWLAGFRLTGIEKYDGTTNPESWLTVYGLAIHAAGGDSKAMANYLPVALADSARSWLHGLPRGTIGSWAELRDHFIANFQGTFERPGTHFDHYNGIRHEDLVGKFERKPPKTVKQMFGKANEYTKAEDAIIASKQSGTTWKPKKDTPTTGGSGSTNHKDRKRKPEELVATTTPSSRQRSRVNTFDKIMNSQCPHHPNSNHTAKDCFVYKQFTEQYTKNSRKASDGDQSTSKKKDDDDDVPTGFQDHRKELNHIFGGPLAYESKRKQKLTKREINAVQPDTPQFLRWSKTTIKFDLSDHPDRVVHPGRYPLVLDPVVRNVRLRRSLIDGGSALNILFAKILDDMQIPRAELRPSNAPFHGVIPGLSATPLGQITLPVTFGTRENFRTENVCFEVADFETAYHAILGRLALAKFMAVPHYTYMMMKMLGPRGVISLRSDIKQAIICDKESYEVAQTREITLAREEIRLAASTASEGEVPTTKMPKSGESDAKTQKIPLDLSDPTKTAVIGTELDCK